MFSQSNKDTKMLLIDDSSRGPFLDAIMQVMEATEQIQILIEMANKNFPRLQQLDASIIIDFQKPTQSFSDDFKELYRRISSSGDRHITLQQIIDVEKQFFSNLRSSQVHLFSAGYYSFHEQMYLVDFFEVNDDNNRRSKTYNEFCGDLVRDYAAYFYKV
jgi:hypothetical protein